DLAFLDGTVNAFDIAYSHTIYNIILSSIFLPGRRILAQLAMWTWPDGEEDIEQYELLDERLFATPAVAVDKAAELVQKMGETACDMVQRSTFALMQYDEKMVKKIKKQEKELDNYEDKLGTFLVHLSAQNLKEKDNYRVSNLLYFIGDFERIGDHALNITYSAREMHEKNIYFSEDALAEVQVLNLALVTILQKTIEALKADSVKLALDVEPLEEVIDDLTKTAKNRHIKRMQKGLCSIEMGFVLTDLLTNYERIADHCSNVASALVESSFNQMQRHAYIKDLTDVFVY
ncbi:MAG: PhoU domain-containing protein, partial [Vagococcus sp.]|nr:PhoU domain-containing protein [Vagococcus sp.]